MAKITVLYKPVGLKARLIEVENELHEFQKLVGGYIETISCGDFIIVCDEEGRLYNKDYNFTFMTHFFGDVFFCGVDGEDFCDFQYTEDDFRNIYPELFEEPYMKFDTKEEFEKWRRENG